MLSIKQIRGLKYPDEYFTKFFFKNNLHQKEHLKYLEFGCGNGSNLMLPYQYENEVVGIDYDQELIAMAKENFALQNSGIKYHFYADDMRTFAKSKKGIEADVLILPSVIYYISREDFIVFLKELLQNNHLKSNIPFYIRIRTPKDFRYGYGEKITQSRFKMPAKSLTGEHNAEIEFYTESEIVEILKEILDLRKYKIFSLDNQNEHNGVIVLNSDIVIWGTIN